MSGGMATGRTAGVADTPMGFVLENCNQPVPGTTLRLGIPLTAIRLIFVAGLVAARLLSATDTSEPLKPWEPYIVMLEQAGVHQTSPDALAAWLRTAPPSPEQWVAIEIMGLRGDREAIPVLRKLRARQDDRLVQESSALALARLHDKDGQRELAILMESSIDWNRQLFLAARLAELGNSTGYRFVSQAASDRSVEHRFASAAALVAFLPLELASAGAIDPERRLLTLANDQEARIRFEFVVQTPIAISRGGNRDRFEAALRGLAADDPDAGIRERARLMMTGLEFVDRSKRKEAQTRQANPR